MRRVCPAFVLALAVGALGCAGTETTNLLTPDAPPGTAFVDEQNPVYIPLGRDSYGPVFENVLTVLGDYGFQFDTINRYDGRIETQPRIAPGLLLFLKPGSPNCYERSLATAQTYRHRVCVQIIPAEQGGYFIAVTARKELENLPRPVRSMIGSAIFGTDAPIDRVFEVVDPNIADGGWIYKGRDTALEQEIIRRLQRLM